MEVGELGGQNILLSSEQGGIAVLQNRQNHASINTWVWEVRDNLPKGITQTIEHEGGALSTEEERHHISFL